MSLEHEELTKKIIGAAIEVHRRLGPELEKQPADMSVKKALLNIVRVVLVIHMLVVASMVGGPFQHRAFKGRGTKEQNAHPHRPSRPKCQV